MKQELQYIQHCLRRLRLLTPVEYMRYLLSVRRYKASNQRFLQLHPDFPVPPKHLAYDAYSAADWDYYYRSGLSTANDVAAILEKYCTRKGDLRVLEWGCGPGRSIRHLPTVLGSHAEVYGTDYNHDSIAWCKAHFPAVHFATNNLMPPLPFENQRFDLVYALSVFTHLSEGACTAWIKEVSRVLKQDGVVFFTTHSDADAQFLLEHEKTEYRDRGFCVRGVVQEGKKMFGAWHSPDYVKNVLLADYELLEHGTPGRFEFIHTQDAWIARKR